MYVAILLGFTLGLRLVCARITGVPFTVMLNRRQACNVIDPVELPTSDRVIATLKPPRPNACRAQNGSSYNELGRGGRAGLIRKAAFNGKVRV